MKIVHIVPGSAGPFYCQNCLRDAALVRALRQLSDDAIIVPLYLPLIAEAEEASAAPIFFGAVRLYLKERWPAGPRLPAWLQRVLDSPRLLHWAGRCAGSTRSAGLEEMTLSMLHGLKGHQGQEVRRLIRWLQDEGRPDIVHLSNALLAGLAEPLAETLRVPVLCSLQDEDTWIESMRAPYPARVWATIAACSPHIARFVAVSHDYADRVRDRLQLPTEKFAVVYPGVPVPAVAPSRSGPEPPVLGFLSRMCRDLGLEILVDTFLRLRRDYGLANLQLKVMGGCTRDDRALLRRLRTRLRRAHALAAAEFCENPDRETRLEFLQSLSLLSVPAPEGEAFGLHLIEAMSVGVPVVQPAVGAYPEIVRATGGGLLVERADPELLAAAAASLLQDPQRRYELGCRGQDAVRRRFSVEHMAARMSELYRDAAAG